MQLRKATRKKAKIRLGLSAVSGAGKTYSALLIAKGICGDWNKIAIIDSENNSADLYAHLGDYNVLPISAPFTPEKYVEAIHSCEKAGMEVIKDNNGKVKVEKSGLREITREGFEYELTINLEMDTHHNASASKDRTNLFMGKPAFVPGEKTGELIAQWCEQGEEAFEVIKPGSDWYKKVEDC